MNPTYIIGEIGLNHNGDLDTCKKLIDLAWVAGCDACKFQKRSPDKCVPEYQKNQPKSTPWGDMTYLEYKYRMEFGKDEYDEIDAYCKGKIEWSASPWDMDSLQFLTNYDVPWIKIPSAHLTNKDLVVQSTRYCQENNKKLIISTGMSTEEEVDKAYMTIVKEIPVGNPWAKENLVIMHCNSTYPADVDELNLSCIKTLKEKYGCIVGYSGHEFILGTTVAAVYLGSEYIERHITLDRNSWGSDHLASVGPKGIIGLVSGIRELEKAYGDGKIRLCDSEMSVRKKLRGT